MLQPSKQTDDGNLKIARFLGIKILENEELVVPGIYESVDKVPFLRFDKSLDWLFVALCYLEGLGYSIMIEDGACVIQEENGLEPIAWNCCIKDTNVKDLIEAVFNSCLEAIDNYYDTTAEKAISTVLKNFNEWNLEEEDVE